MDFFTCSSVTFLNKFLNMNNGMILPLLPISILYRITIVFLPDCVSSSAVSNDQILFKCTELILTLSISPSFHSCDSSISSSFTALSLLLWHTFLKCLILIQPAHVLLYARHCLSVYNLPQYLHGCHCAVGPGGCLVLPSFAFSQSSPCIKSFSQ